MRLHRREGNADLSATLVDSEGIRQAPPAKLKPKDLPKPQVDLFPDLAVCQKPKLITSTEDVRNLVNEMIAQSYPELKGEKIRVVARAFSDPLASMESRPQIGTLLPFTKTRYVIVVNKNVFGRQMTMEVAKGYLAHELAHAVYYVKRGFPGVMVGLASSLLGYRFMPGWERATDLEGIRRGYGVESKTATEWYLSLLTPEQRAKKLRKYLSPEEMTLAMTSSKDAPIWCDWRKYFCF